MDKIEELLTRGVANIIPGKEELRKALTSGKKLNIYLGIDPTSTKIHLGHAVPLRKLQTFAELGHHVTFLIGDFTALVGDTSDKESERPILTPEEVEKNFQTYKKQAEKLVDFSKVKVKRNSDWLKKLTYQENLKLKQQFSLNDFISRELIRKRLDAGKRVRLDETEYPIMQGYDSYIMDTDIQLGATDQTFNMQAGRTLQKALRKKESFIIANNYLEGTDGRKMSKTWGNAIWLDDTAEDMYAKVMAIKDELIVEYFTLATNVPLKEIEEIRTRFLEFNRMYLKKKLAFEIVKQLNNDVQAKKAQEYFEKTVQRKEMPSSTITVPYNQVSVGTITDALVTIGFAESKSEARRLIDQGGVEVNNEKIENATLPFDTLATEDETIIQVGRRRVANVKK